MGTEAKEERRRSLSAAPDMVTINIRCLDDYDAEKAKFEVRTFDGKNWEETIATFKL
jgi:hypothetical protein